MRSRAGAGQRSEISLTRDVIATRRVEEASRQSEARLAAIFAQASVGLAEISLDGRFLRVNDEICRIFGRSRQQVLATGVLEVTFEDDAAKTQAAFTKVVEARELPSIDKRYVRPNGALVWANSSLTRLDDEQGTPYSVLAVVVDLSARKADEERLRSSEAGFQAIANSIDQMVWSSPPDGFHDFYNQRWHDYVGALPGSADGSAWNGVQDPADRERVRAAWRHSLETGEPNRIEYRMRHHSGQYRWVLGRAQAVRDAAGGITRWYGTCTDIQDLVEARETLARSRNELERLVTERTASLHALGERLHDEVLERGKTEAQLRQSLKMEAVGQLTGGIAHDFNNLLQGVSASLDLVQTRLAQGRTDHLERYVTMAMTSVRRAISLTQRLLAFGRRQTLDPESVDANPLIAGLEALVRQTAGTGITVETVLSGGLWLTLCDANQLENAVLNLAINAHDAMPGGGRLTIETANARIDGTFARTETDAIEPGQYVSISVTDTGIGMPPDIIAHAFEPFFTTKPVGQGTGLGLSMVYGFVKQSRGHVRIHSEEGRGTTVRLYLPRHFSTGTEAGPPVAGNTGVEQDETGETIRVVEDEASVRPLLVEPS